MTDIVERATKANPIQAAEDVLAKWHADTADIWALADCVEPLIKHARTLEDELARKTAVADAYWEIIESFKKENAELRAALRALVNAETVPHHTGYDSGSGGGNFVYTDAILTDCDEFRKARALAAKDGGA